MTSIVLLYSFLEYHKLLFKFIFRTQVNQSISHIIVRCGQRRARFLLCLGGERDLGVEQAPDDADGQTHKVGPREQVVATYYHSWKKKIFYSKAVFLNHF